MTQHTARESWLQDAIAQIEPWFVRCDVRIPENIRITVGFGPSGAKQESQTIMGGTLHTRCSADGAVEIFISPESAGAFEMLSTLAHELVHAILLTRGEALWWGHTGLFSDLATDLGLVGPMVSSVPGPDLTNELETIATALGAYPGARVTVSGTGPAPEPAERQSTGPKRQVGSRYLLTTCTTDPEAECFGYQVRMTQKHREIGQPRCPYGHLMTTQK